MMIDFAIADFETRSLADLDEVGGRRYWGHPTTEVVCCSFELDGAIVTWLPGDDPPPAVRTLVANNARGFERHGWKRMGWPEPERWIDSAEVAASSGLPRGLDGIAERLGISMKDRFGNAVTLALSRTTTSGLKAIPNDHSVRVSLKAYHKQMRERLLGRCEGDWTRFDWPTIPSDVLAIVTTYCESDIRTTREAYDQIVDFVDLEPEVLATWTAVNDRGILFDCDLARALLAADAKVASSTVAEARAALKAIGRDVAFDESDLRSNTAFPAMMRWLGVPCENAQYDTVEPLTRHPNAAVAALARARIALSSIAAGKLRAGLARVCPDGRYRDSVLYFGAHTGRGSGSGMQWHNLPAPDGLGADGKKVKDWDDARVCAEVAAPRDWNQAEISMLLRACAYAPPGRMIVAADFSQVEARFLAWAAGDAEAIAAFGEGDPYARLAWELFGGERPPSKRDDKKGYEAWKASHYFERDTAKKAELGCGYQMGAPKFVITAEKGGMKWDPPCNGHEVHCTNPKCGTIEHDWRGNPYTHGAKRIVDKYRAVHPAIVDFWYALEQAAVETCDDGNTRTVGPYTFVRDGADMAILMPDGAPLVYRLARLVGDAKGRPKVRYEGPNKPVHLYGGLIAENCTQKISRQFMVHCLVQAERDGLCPILTVHDEIACEVPEDDADEALALLLAYMHTVPEWAAGFPAAAEGWKAKRYRK